MPVVEVGSEAEFRTITANSPNSLIVVDFTAVWCGPCKRISPVFEKLSDKYRQAVFLKVDVDQNQELAVGHGVSAMPTFLFLKGGAELDRIQGADEEGLESKVKEYVAGSVSGVASFSGEGQRLGGTSSNQLQALDKDSLASMEAAAQAKVNLDETKPVTRVSIRLANGNKLTAKLNLTHPVSAIREFICNAVPDQAFMLFGLMTVRPRQEISEESLSIEQANLAGSVVIQTLKDN